MTPSLVDLARWIATGPGWMPVLAGAVLKATTLLVVAWLTSLLLRRSSAAMRHLVWTVALVGSLALPLLLPVVPRLPVPLLPRDATPAVSQGASPSRPATAAATRTSEPLGPPSPQPPSPLLATSSPATSPATWLLAIWGTVAAGLLTRLGAGMVRLRRLARRPAIGAAWLPMARDLAAEAGVGGRVTFVEGPADGMPMTWGLWQPAVLVPAGAESWPEPRLRIVLLHELAHVARYDCLTQALAGTVCAIYWFNPLAWMAAGRLVAERERACDDAVLAAGADGPDYAEQLLDVARAMRTHGGLTWATVSIARRTQLEGRLLAILDPGLPRHLPTRAAAAVLAAFLVVLVPSLAALEAGPRGEDATDVAAAARTEGNLTLPSGLDETTRQLFEQAVTPGPRPTPTPTPKPSPSPTPKSMVRGDHEEETRPPVDQKVIDALTAALKDADSEVREHAVMALGRLRDRRATGSLVASLADPSADVRENAVMALGELRDPAAVEPLIALLADEAPDVREQAAIALGQLRDARAVEPLIAAIADGNADVREQAVVALGELRSAKAVDALIAALKDASGDVQEQAAFALSQLRDKRAVDPLIAVLGGSASPSVRERAAFALGEIGDARASDALMAALKDAHAEVRKASAFALSQTIGRER